MQLTVANPRDYDGLDVALSHGQPGKSVIELVAALQTQHNEVDDERNLDVRAVVAVADATGGAQGAALTLQLLRMYDQEAAGVREVLLVCHAAQYDPGAVDSSPTFGTATAGAIVASGNGWALVRTNATGAFACTLTNATDETLYVSARAPTSGISSPSYAVRSVSSNSDAVVWSA